MTWRDQARPIIASVLADNPGLPEKELRKKLREAYPFYQRLHHPYKIWCDEINVHLGKKKPRERKNMPAVTVKPCEWQKGMFDA